MRPKAPRIDFEPVKQPSGKVITAFAVRGDLDLEGTFSNTFELEWPKGSGKIREFPEIDRVGWFSVAAGSVEAAERPAAAAGPSDCRRSEATNRVCLDSVDGQCAAVDSPAGRRPHVLVVISQMPDQVGDLIVGDGPVMRDAGDPAQCVVDAVARGIHLADDGMLGAGHGGQRRHRGADTVAAMVRAHRLQRPGRIR